MVGAPPITLYPLPSTLYPLPSTTHHPPHPRDGATLYIGKAKNLRTRVKSYLSGTEAKTRPRMEKMIDMCGWIDFILTPTERDALSLEAKLVNLHQPPYNVQLKDDASYPYICGE